MMPSATFSPGLFLINRPGLSSIIKNRLANAVLTVPAKTDIKYFFCDENCSSSTQEAIPVHIQEKRDGLDHSDSSLQMPDIHVRDIDAVLFFPSTTSTQIVLDKLHHLIPERDILVTSRIQIEGRGRRGERTWDSPPGCAMFSFSHRLPLMSFLGQRLGFVQHLLSLSVVRCFRDYIPSLKIKWPNDVYYKDKKISGVIVNSSLSENQKDVCILVGTGINVDNSAPTDCINRILREDINSLKQFTIDEVISNVVNTFKNLVGSVDDAKTFEEVKEEYLKHWMHSGQELEMQSGKSMKIVGVDDQGYLLGKNTISKEFAKIGHDFEEISLPIRVDKDIDK